jgi:uncharacterized protein YbbC (DUF1343 family)
MGTQNGIDRLLVEDFGIQGKRLGLITNHSGVSASLVSTIDIVKQCCDLRALYGPEHGVRGDVDAGGTVETYTDPRTGLPVYSIYGSGDNRPDLSMLEDIDCLLIDIQDVGCRFYTFISTMYNAMEVCARAGKTFMVLDRINPINGVDVEGNLLDPAYTSFIGIAPIPQRHGMTMGELALFFNQECALGCDLKVIPLWGWKREQFGDETGIPWVNPSPNMPSVDAALLYPGTCLFEGTNISEGRGTTKPFELIGAPWLDADTLATALNSQNLPGIIARPACFQPWVGKFSGEFCQGVQLHVVERRAVRSVEVGLRVLDAVRTQDGERFAWRQPVTDRYSIDLLAGTDVLRAGSLEAYLETCKKDAVEFAEQRLPYLLY